MKSPISLQAFLLVMTSGRMLLAFCGERPRILLNILWYTGHPPQRRIIKLKMSAMSDWEAIVYFQKLKCIILTFTAYSLSRPSEWKWRKVMDTIHGHHTVFLAKWNHQTDSNILCICTNFPCLKEWDILDIFDKRRMDFYSREHETVNGKVQWVETMTLASTKLKIKACVPGQPYYLSCLPFYRNSL